MSNPSGEVVFVLELVVALGPLAFYVLGLGLVNSQARPCVVRARADFVLLAIACVPMVMVPVAGLVMHGWFWLPLGTVAGAAALFLRLLPAGDGSWVMYNVEPGQCRRLLERSCRRLGWSVESSGDSLSVAPAGVTVNLRVLSWLRNVTVEISGTDDPALRADAGDRLMAAVDEEAQREAMLPSPAGASLVLIGTLLLAVPMWHLFRQMDAIAEVVRRILFA